MSRRLVGALLFVPLVGVSSAAAQGPSDSCRITCVNDWRNAFPGDRGFATQVGARIASQCSDASKIDWDETIAAVDSALREVQAALRAGGGRDTHGFIPPLQATLRMARQEKQHVASATRECASRDRSAAAGGRVMTPAARAPGDSNVRSLSLDPIFARAASEPRVYAPAPEFRSWVPQYLRNILAAKWTVSMQIGAWEGPVTIQRGNKVIKLADALSKGNVLILRPGDLFNTGPGGRIQLYHSGHGIEIWQNSTFGVGVGTGGECLVRVDANRNKVISVHLIRGTLLWATTHTQVDGRCLISFPGFAMSVRGTEFTATSTPSEGDSTVSVSVTSGAVEVTTTSGVTETIVAGQSRTLRAVFAPAPASARECADRAKLTTDITALEQQIADAHKTTTRLFETVSRMNVGELLDLQNRTIRLADLIGRLGTARAELNRLPACNAAAPTTSRN